MRIRLTCLLSCCTLISLLAACGRGTSLNQSSAYSQSSATDVKDNDSLDFAWWGNQFRGSGTLAVLDEYSKSMSEIPIIPHISEWADYWTVLATDAAGHILPDVIQMDYFYLNQFFEKNLLIDISPFEGTDLIAGQPEEYMSCWTVDGKCTAISGGVSAPALIYNRSLLDSLGISVKDRMTTEEFIEISREVFEKTGIKTNIAYGVEGFQEFFCRAYGECLYEEDRVGAAVKTLEKYYGLYEQGYSEGWLIDPGAFSDITIGSVEQDPLLRKSSPEITSWCDFAYSYQMYAIRQAAPKDIKLGIASWPSDHPEKSAYLRPGPGLSISIDASSPEEAARLIGYMTDPEIQLSEIHGERGVPYEFLSDERNLPVRDESNREVVRFLKEVVKPVATEINPPVPAWAVQAFALNGSLVEKLSYGECTAKEAAEAFLRGCRNLQN